MAILKHATKIRSPTFIDFAVAMRDDSLDLPISLIKNAMCFFRCVSSTMSVSDAEVLKED